MMTFSTCPHDADSVAEKYCLDRLDSSVAEAFEDHYLACPPCAFRATEAYDFLQAFRFVQGPPAAGAKKSRPARKFR